MSSPDPTQMTREEIENELLALRKLASSRQSLFRRPAKSVLLKQRMRALQIALKAK